MFRQYVPPCHQMVLGRVATDRIRIDRGEYTLERYGEYIRIDHVSTGGERQDDGNVFGRFLVEVFALGG